MAGTRVIQICVLCQILLFGFLAAQSERFPLYGRRQLRYQWPPETPPLPRRVLASGRSQTQMGGSTRQNQNYRLADFYNNNNNNDAIYRERRDSNYPLTNRRTLYRQNLRLPARTTQRRSLQTRTRMGQSQSRMTSRMTYNSNRDGRHSRLQNTRYTGLSRDFADAPRRSNFESTPIIRTASFVSQSPTTGLQNRPTQSGISEFTGSRRSRVSPSTYRVRQLPSRGLSRTFYNSQPPSNSPDPNLGQTVESQSDPRLSIVQRQHIHIQPIQRQHHQRQPAQRRLTQRQYDQRQPNTGKYDSGRSNVVPKSSQYSPKQLIPRQQISLSVQREQNKAATRIPTSESRHVYNVKPLAVQPPTLLTGDQTADLLNKPATNQAHVSSVRAQNEASQDHDIHSMIYEGRIAQRTSVSNQLANAPAKIQNIPTHHGSSIHGPRVASLHQGRTANIPHVAVKQNLDVQKHTLKTLQEQMNRQGLSQGRSDSMQHQSSHIYTQQKESHQPSLDITQQKQGQQPLSQQSMGIKQPFVETQTFVQSVVQPQQPKVQAIVQSQQPNTQSVVQPREATVQSIVQPQQPHVQSIVHPQQPHVQSIVHPQQPRVQSVVHHQQPHVQSVVHPQQPHVQSVVHPQQPRVQSIVHPQQPHVQSVVHPQQPHVLSIVQPNQSHMNSQNTIQPDHVVQQHQQSHASAVPAVLTHGFNTNPAMTGHLSEPSPVHTQSHGTAGATKTLHDELVDALVAALEGRLSTSGVAGSSATASVQPPAQTHTAHGYMQPNQYPWGSQMHALQSTYGQFQQLYPAHMYPAYMQEMMFGDTQDPPDPTQPTPNITTALPHVTTALPDVTTALPDVTTAFSDIITAIADVSTASSNPEHVPLIEVSVVPTGESSPNVAIDLTTANGPVDTTPDPETSTLDMYPETSTMYQTDATPVDMSTTDIPLPGSQKDKQTIHIDSKVLNMESVATHTTEKLKTMFKAAQSLRGQISTATRQKLLAGIRDIIAKSNVDLASLNVALNNKVAALKASLDIVPTAVTNAPTPSHDTTLATPTVTEHGHVTYSTSTPPLPQTTKQSNVEKVVKVRSLIDQQKSTDALVLQSILKEIAMQSKGKNTLPKELKNVNFKNIANSLVHEGTDLATQLADPNFIKLLREIVSKLHSFANAPEVTTHLPDMTTYSEMYTTTGEYEI